MPFNVTTLGRAPKAVTPVNINFKSRHQKRRSRAHRDRVSRAFLRRQCRKPAKHIVVARAERVEVKGRRWPRRFARFSVAPPTRSTSGHMNGEFPFSNAEVTTALLTYHAVFVAAAEIL